MNSNLLSFHEVRKFSWPKPKLFYTCDWVLYSKLLPYGSSLKERHGRIGKC